MALNIETATMGYDRAGVEALIKEIRINVVDAACTAIDNGYANLAGVIDSAWVGAGAEQYKLNVASDCTKIKKVLTETSDILCNELRNLASRWAELDNNIIGKRGE